MRNNQPDAVIEGLNILQKIIQNSLKDTENEQQMRVWKKSNKTIEQKLMSLKPKGKILDLIDALGYESIDDVSYAYIQKHNISNLVEANMVIQE